MVASLADTFQMAYPASVDEVPCRPWDQAWDNLLTQADLPKGWYLPRRYPGEHDDHDMTPAIDKALGYDDAASMAEQEERWNRTDELGVPFVRWRYIEHADSHTRVHIRLERQEYANPPEVRITGVSYLPRVPGDPVTGQQLRQLPIAAIEMNINKRLFEMTHATSLGIEGPTGPRIKLPSGKSIKRSELLAPIKDGPKRNPDFYHRVALQHIELSRTSSSTENPTAWVAKINDVPLSTAQGWVTRARSMGLLPPSRPGRSG